MIKTTAKSLARARTAGIYSHSINLIKSRINCDAGFAKNIMDKYSLGDSEFPPASFVFFETGEEGEQEVQKGIVNLLLQILHYEDYQISGPFQKMIFGYLKQNAEFQLEQLKFISGKDYRTFVQLYEKIIRITGAGQEYFGSKGRRGIIDELKMENKEAEKEPLHYIETTEEKKQESQRITEELLSIVQRLQMPEWRPFPQEETVRRFLESLSPKDQEDMAALLGFRREELMEMVSHVRRAEWAELEKTIRDRLLEVRQYISGQEIIVPGSREQNLVSSEFQPGLGQEALEAPGLEKWKNILQKWIIEIDGDQWKKAASLLRDSGVRISPTLKSLLEKEDRRQAAQVLERAETMDDIYPLLTMIYREDQLREEGNIQFSSLKAFIDRRELEEREKTVRETEGLEERKNRIIRQAESFEDQEWRYMEENYFHTRETLEREDYISQIRELPTSFQEEVLKVFFRDQDIEETELDRITEEQWQRIGKTSVWALDKAVFLSQAVRWNVEEVEQAESLLRREYRDYYRQKTVQDSRQEVIWKNGRPERREENLAEKEGQGLYEENGTPLAEGFRQKEMAADIEGSLPVKETEAPGLEQWKYLLREWISYMDQDKWEILAEEARAEKEHLSPKAEEAFQEGDRYQVSMFLSSAETMEEIYPLLEMVYRKEELKGTWEGWLPGLESLVERQSFLTKKGEPGKERTLKERREMVARIAELMDSQEWQYIERNYLQREKEEKNSSSSHFQLLTASEEKEAGQEEREQFGWNERRTLERESQEIWNIEENGRPMEESADKEKEEKETEAPSLERWKYLLREWVSYMDQDKWEILAEEARAEKEHLSPKAEEAFQKGDRYQVSMFLSSAGTMEEIYPLLEMVYRKEELKETWEGWLPGLESLVERQSFLTKKGEPEKERTLREQRKIESRMEELTESRERQYIEKDHFQKEKEKKDKEQTGPLLKAESETDLQLWKDKETFLVHARRFNEKQLEQAEELLRKEYNDYYGMTTRLEEKNSNSFSHFRLLLTAKEKAAGPEEKRWFGWKERRTLERESRKLWNIEGSGRPRQESADKEKDDEKRKEAPGLERWKYLLREWVDYMDQEEWDIFIQEGQKEETILSPKAQEAFLEGNRYEFSSFLSSAGSMEEIYPLLEIIYRNDGLREASASWLPGLKPMIEKQELFREAEKFLEGDRLEERRQELLRLAELFDSRELSYRETFVSEGDIEREKEIYIRQAANLPEEVQEDILIPAAQIVYGEGSPKIQEIKDEINSGSFENTIRSLTKEQWERIREIAVSALEKNLLLINIRQGGEGELRKAAAFMKQAENLYYGYDISTDSQYIQEINDYPELDIIYPDGGGVSKEEKILKTDRVFSQASSKAMELLKLVEQEIRERERQEFSQEREISSATSHSQRVLDRRKDRFQEYREALSLAERQEKTRMVLLTRSKDLSAFLEKTVYAGGTVYQEGTRGYFSGQEEGEPLPPYAPASMVVTRPQERAGRQQQMTPSLDIEKVVRQVKEESIKDIRFIDRGSQTNSQTGESFRQMEELLRKISEQQKELEGIKQTQAGMIQMVDPGKIADTVMKQFKAQLRVEKLRRGL